jgi:hypothetical protein
MYHKEFNLKGNLGWEKIWLSGTARAEFECGLGFNTQHQKK